MPTRPLNPQQFAVTDRALGVEAVHEPTGRTAIWSNGAAPESRDHLHSALTWRMGNDSDAQGNSYNMMDLEQMAEQLIWRHYFP